MSKNLIIGIVAILLIVGGILFYQKKSPKMISGDMKEQISAKKEKNIIMIKDFAFSPSLLKVKVGEKIIVKNEDLAGHSVTSDDGSTFDTGVFGNGESREITITKAGTFSYHCMPHPNMKAQIVVE